MTMSTTRKALLQILDTKAVVRLPAPVQLASGAWSSEFVDGKEGLQHWRDLKLAAQAIVETVHGAGIAFDAAGGLTMGADALSVAIASVADCRWFFVRKEPKSRGTARLIEGAQINGADRVLLVEDVVTSGGSMLQALAAIEKTGPRVVAAVTLVDRADTAATQFAALGIPYFPMATYHDLNMPPVAV